MSDLVTKRPDELDIPVSWAESGTATDPGATLRAAGWASTDAPAYDHVNWLFRSAYRVQRWVGAHLLHRGSRPGQMRGLDKNTPFELRRDTWPTVGSTIQPVAGTNITHVDTDGDLVLVLVGGYVKVYDASDDTYIGQVGPQHSGSIQWGIAIGYNESTYGEAVFAVVEQTGAGPYTTYLQTYRVNLSTGVITYIGEKALSGTGTYGLVRPRYDGDWRLVLADGANAYSVYFNADGTLGTESSIAFNGDIRGFAILRAMDSNPILFVAHAKATSRASTANVTVEACRTTSLGSPLLYLEYVEATYDDVAANGISVTPEGLVVFQRKDSASGDGRLEFLSLGQRDLSGYPVLQHRVTLDNGQSYPTDVVAGPGGVALCLDGVNGYSTMISTPWLSVVSDWMETYANIYYTGVVEATDGWDWLIRDGDTLRRIGNGKITGHGIRRNPDQNYDVCPWAPWLRYIMR